MRRGSSALRWSSVILLLLALILVVLELVQYSRVRTQFPQGLRIAGVDVGRLDRQGAAERLLQVYSLPVELVYGNSVIHMDPAAIGFELKLEAMLAAADLARVQTPFWQGFFDYLWARSPAPRAVPLDWSYSESRLRTYLMNEIVPRYDIPAASAQPIVGTVNFMPGTTGQSLDLDAAILPIENALQSITNRRVVLPLRRTAPPPLAFSNLQVLLRQTIDQSGYDGLIELYVLDLQSGQEIQFAYRNGETIDTQPDIAFTGASVVKVPIMVSVYRRIGENADPLVLQYLNDMIELSGNDPADWVMQRTMDQNLGPLMVTQDLRALGLTDTFLAGMFYLGAPLLDRFQTPANQRKDISTNPDPYNQMTVTDIGMLMTDIYQCARNGGGTFAAVFPGEITQQECQDMVDLLTRNQLGALIKAGVPDGTRVAHKHGWTIADSGVMTSMGTAGIVYTPGGDYVMVVFMYHPVQLVWDPASELVKNLSRATYNYFNLPQ